MRDVAVELKGLRLYGMASAWGDLTTQSGLASLDSSRWLSKALSGDVYFPCLKKDSDSNGTMWRCEVRAVRGRCATPRKREIFSGGASKSVAFPAIYRLTD